MAAIELSESDSGRTIGAKRGDLIAVHLDENPMTGYQWTARLPSADAWRLVRTEFSPGLAGRVGAGGSRTWLLEAVGVGTAHIVFDLRRGWTSENPVKHVEIELVAR